MKYSVLYLSFQDLWRLAIRRWMLHYSIRIYGERKEGYSYRPVGGVLVVKYGDHNRLQSV